MSEPDKDFLAKINAIKNSYKTQLPEKISLIANYEKELSERSVDFDNWEDVYQLIHKLSGSSAIFGFENISKSSENLELTLKAIINNDKKVEINKLKYILAQLGQLKNTINEEIKS